MCSFIQTMGLWPWKSVSDYKCVTTYPSNEIALKMDDTNIYFELSQIILTKPESFRYNRMCRNKI